MRQPHHRVCSKTVLLVGLLLLAVLPLLIFDLPSRWFSASQLPWVPKSSYTTSVVFRNPPPRHKLDRQVVTRTASNRTTMNWVQAELSAYREFHVGNNSSLPMPSGWDRDTFMMNYEKLVFGSRQATLDKACSRMLIQEPARCENRAVRSLLLQTKGNEIVFCVIEKTGSTFWRRILHIVGGWGNDTNPEVIAAKDVGRRDGGINRFKTRSWKRIDAIFNKTTSLMFVRDPYTKLFSGWLDKFYSTNPLFWKRVGKRIVQKERGNATKHSLICGHDVTFAEFLNFTLSEIENKTCTEMHFAPIYKHCFPCNLSFDYIGKYETLKTDTLFLLEKLNLSQRVMFEDFERDAVKNAINESVKWVFRKKRQISHCISFRCGLFRVWKRLTIRGIIGIDAKFPVVTNQEAEGLDAETFEKMILYAHEHSDPDMLKNNRREAIAEAFNYLTVDLRNRIKEIFKVDFDMFGYETDPNYLRKPPVTGHRYLLDACAEEAGSFNSLLFSVADDLL